MTSVSQGCSGSGQAVTGTIKPSTFAASSERDVYLSAAANAAASIANSATLANTIDPIAMAAASDTILVGALEPQVDSGFVQQVLSGSMDGGTCAGGNRILTAIDLLTNTSGTTMNTP
jgi:hypothetical protein